MYEFHTTQQGTDIHPGQTVDLDYSVTHTMSPRGDRRRAGRAGRLRPMADDRQDRPRRVPRPVTGPLPVNAVGFDIKSSLWPQRNVSLGFKYFKEFSNRSTFQGTPRRLQDRSVSESRLRTSTFAAAGIVPAPWTTITPGLRVYLRNFLGCSLAVTVLGDRRD